MSRYRVAFYQIDGRLGSERIGLPMDLLEARLAAHRYNDLLRGDNFSGSYVVINAETEDIIP